MKTCTKCNVEYPATLEYFKQNRKVLNTICKVCTKAYDKENYKKNSEKYKQKTRQWAKDNAERKKESAKAYHVANLEKEKERAKAYYLANPEKVKEKVKAWQKANPEKVKAGKKAWSFANPERERANNKAWREANPEKVRAMKTKHRALKSGALHEDWTEIEVVDLYGTDCYLCDTSIDFTAPRKGAGSEYSLWVDHIVPLSALGENTIRNVRPCHAKCNLAKHNKSLSEYLFLVTSQETVIQP